jgi:hypothetical protein
MCPDAGAGSPGREPAARVHSGIANALTHAFIPGDAGLMGGACDVSRVKRQLRQHRSDNTGGASRARRFTRVHTLGVA